MSQLVGALSRTPKVADLIPGQGTCLGYGFDPQSGYVQEAADQCFSLMSMSLSLSL